MISPNRTMLGRTYSCLPALCLLFTGFAANVGAILGEWQKITFPTPRSTSNYARLETTWSHDLSSYTLCLHMRSDMSSSLDSGVVSYAVGSVHNELLLFKKDTRFLPHVHDERVEPRVSLPVWDDEWHAICVTCRSGDGAWKIYTDGVLRDSGSGLAVGQRVRRGGTWIIAQDQDTEGGSFEVSQAFIGELSQVNLWDYVLSPAEIGTDWSMFCSHHGNVIDWAATDITIYGLASSERYFHCDVDECLTENGGCDHICTNTEGSFQCSCNPGYLLDANVLTCDDVDECLTENGGCDHTCTNTEGSFQCSCIPGYLLNSNGLTCDDVDECLTENGGCDHICTNTVGSFHCSCNPAYILNSIGLACDVEEDLSTPWYKEPLYLALVCIGCVVGVTIAVVALMCVCTSTGRLARQRKRHIADDGDGNGLEPVLLQELRGEANKPFDFQPVKLNFVAPMYQ